MKISKTVLLLITIFVLGFATDAFAQITNTSVVTKPGDKNLQGELFNFVGQASINVKNEIAFIGTVKSSAIYIKNDTINGDGALRVAVSSLSQAPIPGKFGTFTFPKINDNGEVAFSSMISGGTTSGGIFVTSNGIVKKVALDNEPTPAGSTFTPFLSRTSVFTLNNRGDVVFYAGITDVSPKAGIFLFSNDQLIKVAVNGDPSPTGGILEIGANSIPTINNKGDVLFNADTNNGTSLNTIYLFSGGILKPIVNEGDTAPQGGVFESVSTKGRFLNDQGNIAFLGRVAGKLSIYLAKVSDTGITITRLIGVDDASPDGGNFKNLTLGLTPANGGFSNTNHLLFRADTTKTLDGLFIYLDDKISKVVGKLEATVIGGTFPNDATFNSAYLGSMLSDSDYVVYESNVLNGTSPKAIFLWTPQTRTPITILKATYAKKVLAITATAVNAETKVEINGSILNQSFNIVNPNNITIKGSRKKLKLNRGEGSNQVVLIFNGLRSAAFTF